MPIQDFEIYSNFGALDSEVFDNAGSRRYAAYSSHFLRALAMNHNRLIAKEHLLFNLWWPVDTTASGTDAGASFRVNVPNNWHLVHPPIPIFKLPGTLSMEVNLTAEVGVATNSAHTGRIILQFVTLAARSFDPVRGNASPFVLAVSGDSGTGFQDFALDNIPLERGDVELLQIYAKGDATANLAAIATYGSPNAAQLTFTAGSADQISSFWMVDASATWNLSGGGANNLADDGFYLSFLDGSGGSPLFAPRRIVEVTDWGGSSNGIRLVFDPPLQSHRNREEWKGLGAYYEITGGPYINFANIMGYSNPRTT